MIQIAPQMRLLVAIEPVDFRKGLDGLAGVCRQVLNEEPLSGAVFVFRNRRQTALKILVYDGQGFWLCQKENPCHIIKPYGCRFSRIKSVAAWRTFSR